MDDRAWLEVFLMDYETEAHSNNLRSWTATDISPQKISLQLDFERPLKVSVGDEPDFILVSIQFNFPDIHGNILYGSRVKLRQAPTKMR